MDVSGVFAPSPFSLSLLNFVLLYFVPIVVIFEALNPSVPSLPYGCS